MIKLLVVSAACVGALLVTGCSDAGETGDVAKAQEAAANAPKSPDQLPKDMPPQARASAANAMGQAQAAQAQGNDAARVRAMQEMQKQHK